MIVVQLTGGLGNQMFQYAAGRALSLRRGTGLKLDVSGFARSTAEGNSRREFALGCFRIQSEIVCDEECERVLHPMGRGWLGRLWSIRERWKPAHRRRLYYLESAGVFDPGFTDGPAAAYLVGYWQSERYFLDCEDTIRKDFEFVQEASGENQRLAGLAQGGDSVSVHVRRQDYVTEFCYDRIHGTCEPSYYQRAIEMLRARVRNPFWFVLSDDPTWCKANLGLSGDVVFVENNRGDRAFEDMRLMSLCRHNIIANSSFSWWGAWLNRNPDKIVIAPKRWFRDYKVACRDILPAGWLRF